MRATLLKATLKDLFRMQRTVCVEGPPGGGKTTIVAEVAEELGVPYIQRHLPTALVEDFGMPIIHDGGFDFIPPDWFPVLGKAPDAGILCFDDRNQAGSDLQKVLANICQARTLHGSQLPPGWMVIGTGNRQKDRAGANRILSHLRDRETVLDLDTHLDDWTSWAIDNDVPAILIAFIRFRPDLLHDFKPEREQNATPRSWVEGVGSVVGNVPPEAEYECFKGAVGEGPAAEFVGFVKIYRTLPNPDNIILNPDTAEVPSDPATLYALAGAIAERATVGNFERVCTYAERMPPEFSVLSISYATRKNAELASTGAFTKWAIAHQEVLF